MTQELIKKELQPIVNESLQLKVKSHGDLLVATDLLSRLNQISDRIEEEKQKVLGPLNKARTAEIARWKPVLGFYEDAINYLRDQMSGYQTKLVTEQKKQEQAIADKLSAGTIDLDKAVKAIEKIKTPDSNIATTSGDVQFVTVKKFEVMDVTMLPVDYLLPNETAIREALKVGKQLPGVRYWEEQQPRNYR